MKRLFFALAFLVGLSAFVRAQAPPPVPTLPDTERRTQYSLSGTTCACSIGFAVYGDSTDVDEWLQVWINGTQYVSTDPTFGWSISSATGSLGTIPRPITDGVLTFNSVQTGTVQIVGARRPRRTSQFAENRGVAARDLNQALTDIIAQNRENWDLQYRQLRGIPSEVLQPMPSAATRAGKFLYFDATGLIPLFTTGGSGTGNVVGPPSSTVGHLATWNNTSGTLLQDSTVLPTITSVINVTPASGFNQALVLNQTVTGTQSSVFQVNNFSITDSAAITAAGGGNGLNISYLYGGSTAQGNRQALQAGTVLTAPTSGSNTHHFYVGGTLASQANSSDGGTNTGAGALGSIIGSNPACTLIAAATNMAECAGEEITVQTLSGSSVSGRTGLSISDISGAGGSQGATWDDAIQLTNSGGSPGWKIGLSFDGTNGAAPLSTTGTAIATVGSQTIGSFIDASSATLTNYFLKSANFTVTGAGVTTVTESIGNTSTDGLVLQNTTAATNSQAQWSPRLHLSGNGWTGSASSAVDAVLELQPALSGAPGAVVALSLGQGGTYHSNFSFIDGPSSLQPTVTGDSDAHFLGVQSTNGQGLYGVDSTGVLYAAWCVTCTAVSLGGAASAEVDVYSNNVKRLMFSPSSTHAVFKNATQPGLTSCGSSPAISAASTDQAGTVTMGTGSPTGCTITFTNAYGTAPICTVTWRVNIASMQYAVATNAITLTQTGTSSNVVDYQCWGN